jgi:hypothetical protein
MGMLAATTAPIHTIPISKQADVNITAVIETWLVPERKAPFEEGMTTNPVAQVCSVTLRVCYCSSSKQGTDGDSGIGTDDDPILLKMNSFTEDRISVSTSCTGIWICLHVLFCHRSLTGSDVAENSTSAAYRTPVMMASNAH